MAGGLPSGAVGTRLEREGSVVDELMRHGSRRVGDLSGTLASALGDASISGAAALFVPLAFRGTTYGVLVAADGSAGGRRLGKDDVRLLEGFAAAGSNAIHTVRSVAADRLRHSVTASERERRRWARELHDETLQGLGGLQVLLSSAVRGPAGDLAAAARTAIEHLKEQIASLRALITELRPAALDELGLVPAIETLAHRTASAEGLTVETNIELELEGERRLDPEVESNLYRLAQEALTNVTKHAEASRIEISLLDRNGAVELTVSDDGNGFDPADAGGGFGLLGMRERVALAGGRLEISSQPGGGTTLKAQLPAPGGAGA